MTTAQLLDTGAWDTLLRGGSSHGRPAQQPTVVEMLHKITGETVPSILASVSAYVASLIAADADEYV